MVRVLSVPASVLYAVCFPVLLPVRLAWNWLRVRGELRGVVWSTESLRMAAYEIALVVWPPVAAFGAWGLYWASGWGPDGVGGDVRGAVLGWLAAGLVVLAVHGARYGDAGEGDGEPVVPAHPLRQLARYGAAFSLYLVVALMLVLVPVALILSI
ncbi:hypothetical protein ABH926_006654 [Catenulispora sp. GP43]|uniref:hypothetical protein n=1 Tax=Catenulispora sp. GP43 TaxID=3156263 RepID=UPI003511F4D1